MDILRETLWERFFNRLPENTANEAIRALKRGGSFKDVDFLTLKEAEAQVSHCRAQAQSAIKSYRRWKSAKAVKDLFGVFNGREGAHLRAHARDMASLYLDARRDYAELTALLMRSVANDGSTGRTIQRGGGHD